MERKMMTTWKIRVQSSKMLKISLGAAVLICLIIIFILYCVCVRKESASPRPGRRGGNVPRSYRDRPAANTIGQNWNNYRTFRSPETGNVSQTDGSVVIPVPEVWTISSGSQIEECPPPKYEDLFPEDSSKDWRKIFSNLKFHNLLTLYCTRWQ